MGQKEENVSGAVIPIGARSGSSPSERQVIADRFFRDGRLRQFPAKRKARVAVLLELATLFEPGRVYAEPEVNALLLRVHDDFASLRRELVDHGYVVRPSGEYRLATSLPARAPGELPEILGWEAAWFASHVQNR
ncbi:DUF2087 domain-containing protein [Streptomyces sp. UNOC14_S4]|uniref:DUF2087 domain-containing protein n=1 Tax=Streptomyces sp. UNOC14_S4 TaxID=2872340 RepID=UPI001E35B360|nr:DUF2087 domain-containing protein [Streptomyces sp. UNOC14_S4]MCC3766707.1 DUF2087 domain-containing protein [Streptomyces sp. UNOC14_S4]